MTRPPRRARELAALHPADASWTFMDAGCITALPHASLERQLTALCSRWLTARRTAEDAPHLPFAIPAGIRSTGWIADLRRTTSRVARMRRNRALRQLPRSFCLLLRAAIRARQNSDKANLSRPPLPRVIACVALPAANHSYEGDMTDAGRGGERPYRIDDEWSRAVFARRTGDVAAFFTPHLRPGMRLIDCGAVRARLPLTSPK